MRGQLLAAQLIFYFFNAILIAVAASAVVILLYRRAVLAGMLAKSGLGEGVRTQKSEMARIPAPAIPDVPPELFLFEIDATPGLDPGAMAYQAVARTLQRRLALVYAGAALVPALATSLLYLNLMGIEWAFIPVIEVTGQYLPLVFPTLGVMLVWRPMTVVKAFLLGTLAMSLLVTAVFFIPRTARRMGSDGRGAGWIRVLRCGAGHDALTLPAPGSDGKPAAASRSTDGPDRVVAVHDRPAADFAGRCHA